MADRYEIRLRRDVDIFHPWAVVDADGRIVAWCQTRDIASALVAVLSGHAGRTIGETHG